MAITEKRRAALRRLIETTCERLLAINDAEFCLSRFGSHTQAALHKQRAMRILAQRDKHLKDLDEVPQYRGTSLRAALDEDDEMDDYILLVFSSSPVSVLLGGTLPSELQTAWLLVGEVISAALVRQTKEMNAGVRLLAQFLRLEKTTQTAHGVYAELKPARSKQHGIQTNVKNVLAALGIGSSVKRTTPPRKK